MPAKSSGSRRRRVLMWGLILTVLAIPAAHIARVTLREPYHRWNAKRHARRAAESFAKGDPKRALLEHDRRNAEAIRIVAKSFEALGIAGRRIGVRSLMRCARATRRMCPRWRMHC